MHMNWFRGGLLAFLAAMFLAGGAQAQVTVPTGVTVTPKEGELEVKWSPAKQAASYKVQWGEVVAAPATQTYPDEHTVTSGTSFTIPDLDAGTVYVVQVIAVNAGGDESDAAAASLPTGTTATAITPLPGKAQIVSVTAGVGELRVSWNPVEGVRETGNRYRVEWGATLNGTVDQNGGTSATIGSGGLGNAALDAATVYTVKVIALNDGGEGAPSDPVERRPLPTEVQAVVTTVHADPQKLTVGWTAQVTDAATGPAAGAATGYKVQWRSGSQRFGGDSNREALVAGGTKATYDITGLEGILHTVRVIAVNESGEGPGGTQATAPSVATGTPRPSKVSTPRVTAHADPRKLSVSWDPVPGAGYRVRWKKADADEYVATDLIPGSGQITATSTTIPASGAGNLDGVPYMVQVAAVNGSEDPADSEYSSPATGTPKPAALSAAPTVDNGVEELRVTWSEVTGAEDYTVQWRLANGQYSSSNQFETSDTEYVIPNLSEGAYRVQVWASNASGDGLPTESGADATVTDASDNQVTGVRVTAGVKELTVTWNPVANATYSVAVTENGSPISGSPFETTRTRTVIRDLTAGTLYSVTVTAVVTGATPAASDPAVTARPKPGKVPDVKVTVDDGTSPQQLEVSWGEVADADGYIIQWKSGTEGYSASRQVTRTTGDDEFTNREAIIGDGDGTDSDAQRDGALDGVPHTVQVIAKVGTGDALVEGDPSNPATGTPKPGKVTEVTAAPPETPTPNQLEVKWKDVPGATSYLVEWKSDSGDDNAYHETRQATPSASPYTISRSLTATKIYTVRVTARNASGKGVAPASVVTPTDGADDATGRPKPGRIQTMNVVASTTPQQLDVNWSEVVGATGYKVQWKSGSQSFDDMRQVRITPGTTLNTVLGNGAADSDNPPLDGIPYTVQVIAFSPSTEDTPTDQDGPASPLRTARPKPGKVMGAEVKVHDDPGKLTVTWDEVEGATRYIVEWRNSDGSAADGTYSPNRQRTPPASPYTISGLTADKQYTVQVTAENASGEGVPPVAGTDDATGRPRPAQVPNLRVAAPEATAGGLDLSWEPVKGPTGLNYIVECKLKSDATFSLLPTAQQPVTATLTSALGLIAGELYEFRVRAFHGSDPNQVYGPYSAVKEGRPRPAAPTVNLTGQPKQIMVALTAPVLPTGIEVESYKVEWRLTSASDYKSQDSESVPGAQESYVIHRLEAGDYTVRVRAIVNLVEGVPFTGTATVGTAADDQVTGVRVTPGLGQLRVEWDRVSATTVTGYRVRWWKENDDGTQTYDGAAAGDRGEYTGSGTSKLYTIRNLTGGIQYSVEVRAMVGATEGTAPVPLKVTKRPIAATPGQVVDVKVVPSTIALAVTWKKTDGVTGYKVEWMSGSDRREHDVAVVDLTDADSPSLSIIPAGATGHPALMPGIQYTVRVQAVNEHATTPGGVWSTGVPSMLLPAQVVLKDQDSETTGDQFVVPGANSLTVAWNEAAGAHSYKVQWKSGTLDYHSSRQKVWTDLMKLEYGNRSVP